MRAKQGMRLVAVIATTLLVTSVGQVSASVSGDGASGGCVGPGGIWCGGGGCSWDISGDCTSEGGSEPGSSGCRPGSRVSSTECIGGRIQETLYTCNAQGTGWTSQPGPANGHSCADDSADQICTYNEYGIPEECWEIPDSDIPCDDLDLSASGIQCANSWGLHVSVSVPCQRVGRQPYPRGMVTVYNFLAFDADSSPSWNEAWSRTLGYHECLDNSISHGGRDVRNLRIGLAWGRRDDMLPYWDFGSAGSTRGWTARAAWEHSSYGQPECGPGLQVGEKLPAFPVRVYTYWNAYWRMVYQYLRDERHCRYDGVEASRNYGNCDNDHDGSIDKGYVWKYEVCRDDDNHDGIPDDHCWTTYDSGWNLIDLTPFYGSSYYISGATGIVPTHLEPNPACNGLCIPVIEVQGVIENPRR
jgi:hypothetical protein